MTHYGSWAGPAEETVAAIRVLGTAAIAVQADLSRPANAASILERAVEQFSRADILVNVVAHRVQKLGAWCITMTPAFINAAANVVFLIAGEGKAEALRVVLKGPYQPAVVPARVVRPTRGQLVDAGAAATLRQPALAGNLILIFDGHCGFCTLAVEWIKKLDRRGRVTAVPYQQPGVPGSAGLTLAQCQEAVWAVEPGGRRHRGAAAINAALAWALGLPALLRLYSLPGMRQLQDRMYAWVAANRGRLPGTTPYCDRQPCQAAQPDSTPECDRRR